MADWRNNDGSWRRGGNLQQTSLAGSIPRPRRPKILFFHPWPEQIVVNGERFVSFLDQQTDIQVKVWAVATGENVVDHTAGAPLTDIKLDLGSDLLIAGHFYRCQIRYSGAGGTSPWSANAISRVPLNLEYIPLNVPDEPSSGGTIPFTPEFPDDDNRFRELVEYDLDTGHPQRRLKHSRGRRWTPMVWALDTTADKDTLVAFLEARINASEAFTSDAVGHDNKAWTVRQGTIEIIQTGNDLFEVRIEADEVINVRAWTIGVSLVGGPDRIRGGPVT